MALATSATITSTARVVVDELREEDIEFIQENVDREWERLVGRAGQ